MAKYLNQEGISRLLRNITEVKEYSSLQTTDKTLLGAINELKNSGGGGGTLPEEYYPETYQKIQVPNSLDWTQIPDDQSYYTIADSSSVSLESFIIDNGESNALEIRYISDKNEVDSNGFPYYGINNIDNTWRLYTYYDEYTEEIPVIDEEDFTNIYNQDAFDAIINSFGTHTENQSFQQKFAAEKLTAGEGIIIDNQNKINSSLVGEVLSKAWTETDLGIDVSEVYWDQDDINMNNWVLVRHSSSGYSLINFNLYCTGYIDDYDSKYLELTPYETINWYIHGTEDDSFYAPSNSEINYHGMYPYFVQNGTAYSITEIYNNEGVCSIYLEEIALRNGITPNAAASVFYGNYTFIYDDNEYKYYRCTENNSEQDPEEVTFIDENGDTMYPYFLSYSYLYKWQNNIYLYDSNHSYDGLIYYFNTEEDVTEDFGNASVEIVLHEISLTDLGFEFEFDESYRYESFFNSGLFAQSFWRKKVNKEENYEIVEDVDEFYFDYRRDNFWAEDKEFHYQLNKQTGLWEARTYGEYFLGNGGGYGVFPNRLAVEALELTESPYSFLSPDSYFYGPIKNTTETGDESAASSWEALFVLVFQKTSENLVPNIHIYNHPELQVQSKLKSGSSFIKIHDINKIVFDPQDILRESNLYVDWGQVFSKGDPQNFSFTVKASRSFKQAYWSCIALSSSFEYQGTLTFTFVTPIASTQQLLDNVKVYFNVSSNNISAYCVYAGIGDIKPKISYKIIPISELSQYTWQSALYFNQNDKGDYVTEVLCFRVDLETYDGVSSNYSFYDKFPAEANKFFEGMVEVNTTDVHEEYIGFFCKPCKVPGYYEQITSGTYKYYATPKQKYLPYMRDTSSIISHDDPVVIYDNLVDSNTGDPIPNPDYVNYNNIWTEVTEKQGLPI